MHRNDFLINELENTLYELRDIMYNKLFQKDFVDLEKSIEIVKQKHINQLYIVDVKIQNFVRLLYEIYKNFGEKKSNSSALKSSMGDCILPLVVSRGYKSIKKTKFFKELGKALQEQRKYDIVIDYLSKITTKERRDEFIKEILTKLIQESYH